MTLKGSKILRSSSGSERTARIFSGGVAPLNHRRLSGLQLSVVPTWRKLDLVGLGIKLLVFVATVCLDGIFFGEPTAQIDKLATFAAKWHELGIRTRSDGLVASWATG